MTKAIRFHQIGGSDVLKSESVDLPPPGAGEVRLRHTAIGVNFIDTYFRTGLYPSPLPAGLGKEVAGMVEALGDGVAGLAHPKRPPRLMKRWRPSRRTSTR